jgi:hypothetical protein
MGKAARKKLGLSSAAIFFRVNFSHVYRFDIIRTYLLLNANAYQGPSALSKILHF